MSHWPGGTVSTCCPDSRPSTPGLSGSPLHPQRTPALQDLPWMHETHFADTAWTGQLASIEPRRKAPLEISPSHTKMRSAASGLMPARPWHLNHTTQAEVAAVKAQLIESQCAQWAASHVACATEAAEGHWQCHQALRSLGDLEQNSSSGLKTILLAF